MTSPVATSLRRLGFGALLAAAMAAGTFGGPAIAVLSKFLIDDLDLTRSQVGWLITAFALSGALLSPFAGRLTDRVGGRRALLGIFVVSGLGLVGIAIAPFYVLLLPAALIAGLGSAAANPATNKLIALHVPAGGRGLMTGIKQSGVQAGAFLAGLLLPAGALAFGWRPTLIIAGLVTLSAFAVGTRFLPPTDSEPRHLERPKATERSPLPPAIWWLTIYGALMGFAGGALFAYLPLYAQEAAGFTVSLAGAVAAMQSLLAFSFRILWSRLSERSLHFSIPLARIALVATGAVAVLWLAPSQGDWLMWVGAGLVGLSAGSWNSVGMLAVIVTAGSEQAGRASGIVLFGFLAGLGVGPPIFGYTVDATGSYDWGLGIVVTVFVVALGVMWAWRSRGEL